VRVKLDDELEFESSAELISSEKIISLCSKFSAASLLGKSAMPRGSSLARFGHATFIRAIIARSDPPARFAQASPG